MDDTPKSDSTQANIDDLVKELSRPQNVPPASTPSSGAVPVMPKPTMPMPPTMPQRPTVPPPSMSPKPSTLNTPVMPTKPGSPMTPPASPTAPKEYQSNIRTMTDDLSKLKAGQQLQGVNIPRKIEDQKPPVVAPKPAPVPSAQPLPMKVPSVQTNIGQAQKTPSLPSIPLKPSIPAPAPATPKSAAPSVPAPQPTKPLDQKNQFYVPPETAAPAGGGINRTFIFVGIALAAVVLAVVYWYFLIRQPNEVAVVSPTPVATSVPTTTPAMGLDAVFPVTAGTIVLPASGNPSSAFNTSVAGQVVNPGTFGVINVTNSVASGSAQTFGTLDLFDRFLISYPAALRAAVTGDSRILVYGQQENFDAKGNLVQAASTRIVLVTEVASSSASLLQSWEPSMTSSLAGLLNYDQTKNMKAFTDNAYQGIPIRFKNFPYPDHSIDYALVPYNGNTYWVLASSRESMFAAISAFLSAQ